MKIRKGFVSNSSSSSFIIIGDNILEALEKGFNDLTEIILGDSYFDKQGIITYGDVNKELYRQCKESTNEDVKATIRGLFTQSIYFFTIYQFYKIVPDQECNCFIGSWENGYKVDQIYTKTFDKTIFELPNDIKNIIIDKMLNYYKKTKSDKEYEYNNIITKHLTELSDTIEDLIDKTFKELKEQHKEIYDVSFGDNHGKCCGKIGAFVEWNYLGSHEITSKLNTKMDIYQLNCH